MRATAHCTWGDGPDVLIEVPAHTPWGIVRHPDRISFGMNVHDAKMLVNDLLLAIENAEEFENNFPANPRRF